MLKWIIIIALVVLVLWLLSHFGLWTVLALIIILCIAHFGFFSSSKKVRFFAIDAVVALVILSCVSAFSRTMTYVDINKLIEKGEYRQAYEEVELLKRVRIKSLPANFTDSRYTELKTKIDEYFHENMTGLWSGEYVASNVRRRMELDILGYDKETESYKAIYRFYPHEHQLQGFVGETFSWLSEDRLSKAGAYECFVEIDVEKMRVVLQGSTWIHQPKDYVTITLEGNIDFSNMTITNNDETWSMKKVSDTTNFVMPPEEPETLLANMDALELSETGGFVSYDYVMDNVGSTYSNGLGGAIGDELNWQEYKLDGKYKELRGRAVVNYDYRTMQAETYVSFFGDGVWLYTTPYIQAGAVPDEFVIDVTDVDVLTVNIQGRNVVRLVDCALYKNKNEKSYKSRIDYGIDTDTKPLSEMAWFNASGEYGGFIHYDVVSASQGMHYSDGFGGATSDVNFEEYYLDGEYKTLTGTVLLNEEYGDKYFDNMYVSIYADGVPIYTSPHVGPGMQPDDFALDITGVKVLKVSFTGQNVIRLAECMLKK